MKSITLLACVAILGCTFSNTASASDVRVGVGVDRDGFSFRIGVTDRNNDYYDRHDRFNRRGDHRRPGFPVYRPVPPVVILPAPRCEPPVVVVPPCEPPVVIQPPVCNPPVEVTVTDIVGYRSESYLVGYSKKCELVWDRRIRGYRTVEIDVPVYGVRQVPITVTRVIIATWFNEHSCYGYIDTQGLFQRVQR